jgi:hypothetical protein
MLIELFLVLGSGALGVGTALQVAAWSYDSELAEEPVHARHVLTWMFDGVAFKNDQKDDHPGVLRMRALRRTRTGWVWLAFGAWLTFFGSLISLLTP